MVVWFQKHDTNETKSNSSNPLWILCGVTTGDKRGGLQMVGGGGEAADGGLINRETNGTWKKEMRKKEHFDQVKI